MRISLGKPIRQAHDSRIGHLPEAAVNVFHPRHALLAALLLLLLFLLPRPVMSAPAANLFEQRCESELRPAFEVLATLNGFAVNNTVSGRVLKTRGAYATSADVVLGMTASNTRAEISIDGAALADAQSGRECVAPRVTIELSYQPLAVYVARELHPASCSYREVFAHEMQHVAVYRDSLPGIERRVRDELVARYGVQPLYAPRNKGVAILHEQIESWLRPLLRAELAEVELRQRALDSRDETERLSHMCQGQIASAMGSSF
jgi:hypothetical protein